MKRQTNLYYIVGITALLLLAVFFVPSLEFFRGSPNYCTPDNSCLGQGCTPDPNQPCSRTRTKMKTISRTDPDWSDLLGGMTIPVCTDASGVTISPDKCSACSECGVLNPSNGNTAQALCVPLTASGCLVSKPPKALLNYLNDDPSNISCCGM